MIAFPGIGLRSSPRASASPISISAFGGKADVNHCVGECPLIARSGHKVTGVRSPKFFENRGVRLTVEAVEKLLKIPFSAEIGEHCQSAEFLSY